MTHGRIYGIIPARLQSSRLARKMLLAETGKPLLQHTWEAASRATALSEIIIATDSPEIEEVARGFGARVEMTGEHASGSDRIAEVVRRSCGDADIIVNIQGDEPEVDPQVINRLAMVLTERPQFPMATLATPIVSRAILDDRSNVKCVRSPDGRALYFSRLAIPFAWRDAPENYAATEEEGESRLLESPWLLHLGLYAYRREFLLAFTQMPPSRLEKLESLEQLRVLEAGADIYVELIAHRSVGIDTPEDYARFVERQRRRAH
ncbi:MAG: 3-deoxy-manno-octulosonate cytidylyltransferase [Planctomycetaceae bacterium]